MHDDKVLDKSIRDISSADVDPDSFKEIYWTPDGGGSEVVVVVARGDAAAVLREAMLMLRDDGGRKTMEAVSADDLRTPLRPSSDQDDPSSDAVGHQANTDADVAVSALADMVRTYPDSPDEIRAIQSFQSSCSAQGEISARLLAALLSLMKASEDVSIPDVVAFLGRRRRVAWYAKQLAEEIARSILP